MTAELEHFKHVDGADVFKAGVKVATLTRTPEGSAFHYLDDVPISHSLPVRAEPYLSAGVPAFFAGLLPEGRRLTALRRGTKTSADDELTLLLAIGEDLVGDVQVVPAGEPPKEVEPAVVLDQVRFADLFAAHGMAVDRVGIPGVQDKVSAAMLNLPVRRRGERFILKLDPPEFPHLVANEAFFLEAARESGLRTPRAELVHDLDGRPGLLVTRFDRDGTSRFAFEDALQVLGRWPRDKYLLTSEQVAAALSGVTAAPIVAAATLLRGHAFAYLSGNGDAHAKNWGALQQPDGEWRVSPMFDLPSSWPYGDRTMATTLGGKRNQDLTDRTFVAFGAGLGVPERAVRKILEQVCAASEVWEDRLGSLPFDSHDFSRFVAYRRTMLRPTVSP